jgi:UPF0176 protein
MTYKVAALYNFIELNDRPALQATLKAHAERLDICGIILLAPEGVNGTIAAKPDAMDEFIDILEELVKVRSGELKYSTADSKPFLRMKVRLKKEVITLKAEEEANPNVHVGEYVTAEEWNKLIDRDDVTLVDTRNDYETRVGIFKNALDPDIKVFTEFKDYVEQNLDPDEHKHVAMYCTGGIRCEKASAYMLSKGFENVYHLKGGILQYLEDVPQEESQWDGECFVFDHRVSVKHGLEEGEYSVCFNCREPLSAADTQLENYELGVSCKYCIDELTDERITMLRHRHKQMSERIANQD